MHLRTVGFVSVFTFALLTACDRSSPPSKQAAAKQDGTKATVGAAPAPAAKRVLEAKEPSKAVPTPAAPTTPKAAEPARPGAHWASEEDIFDFGVVWAGARVTHDFRFRNVGTETLEILTTKARCSCSVAQDYTERVAPGGEGIIPFVLGTKNKHGLVNEWLTIGTNDTDTPDMKITLTGIVRTVCQTEMIYDAFYERDQAAGKTTRPLNKKMKTSFGKIKASDRLHRVLKLINTSGKPLSLTLLPLPAGSRFNINLVETTPGEEFELTIIGEPPFPVGRWSAPIHLKTNVPEAPVYEMVAYAYVPSRVEVIPQKIVINQRRAAQKERTIKINNHGDTPVEIVSIATSEPRFDISIKPHNPLYPNQQVILIKLPGDSYDPPKYGELIEIRTSDPEFPLVQMDIVPTLRSTRMDRPPGDPLILHPVDLKREEP